MKMGEAKQSRLTLAALTIVLLIIPFCAGYLFFVLSQRSFYTNRDFRVLDNIGSHISNRIDNLTEVAKSIGSEIRDEPKAAKPEPPKTEPPAARLGKAIQRVNRYGYNLKGQLVPAQATQRRTKTGDEDHPSEGSAQPPQISLAVGEDSGAYWLNFVSRAESDPYQINLKGDIRELIEPLVKPYLTDESSTTEQVFDEVAIAEQTNGRVILESGRSTAHLVTLDTLASGEPRLSDRSSTTAEVEVAGGRFKLFMHPLTLPLSSPDSKPNTRWAVCGLVSVERFNSQCFAVSYNWVVMFAFLLFAALLSMPMIKLALMGPKDRLLRSNIIAVVGSVMLGMSLCAVSLMDAYVFFSFRSTADHQLTSFADRISVNLHDELSRALDQLSVLNNAVSDEASKLKLEESAALGKLAQSPVARVHDLLQTKIDYTDSPYPFFSSVNWVDDKGLQQIQWNTLPYNTAPLYVGDRPYYQNPRADKLWTLHDKPYRFWLESISSRKTGEKLAVVSMKMNDSGWVATMATRLQSLMSPVLPYGYGFCVLDDKGKVQFHSNEIKNLEENFLDECDDEKELKAAILNRTSDRLTVRYLGAGYRLFVTPLPDLPWTLVVFRDEQTLRTTNLEILVLSLVLYTCIVLATGLLWLALALFRRRDVQNMLWPSKNRAADYLAVVWVNVLLGMVLLLLTLYAGGYALIAAALVIPMLSIVCFAVPGVCRKLGVVSLAARKFHTRSTYRARFLCSVTTFLVVLTVLPALAAFKTARDYEIKLLILHGQMSLATRLEDREERIKKEVEQINVRDDQSRSDFLRARLELPGPLCEPCSVSPTSRPAWDVYASFFFGTKLCLAQNNTTDKPRPSRLESFMDLFDPLLNRFSIEKRGLTEGRSDDDTWRSSGDPFDGQRLARRKALQPEAQNDAFFLASSTPRLERIGDVRWWALMIAYALLLLGAVYCVTRFLARTLVLLDIDTTTAREPNLGANLPSSNLVVLRPPVASPQIQWDLNTFDVEDIASCSAAGAWKLNPRAHLKDAIVLDNFDARLDDHLVNRRKLALIEQLLSAKRRVVVVTSSLPSRFPLEPHGNNAVKASTNGQPSPKEESAIESPNPAPDSDDGDFGIRWYQAFSNFKYRYHGGVSVTQFRKSRENPNQRRFYERLSAGGFAYEYLEDIRSEISNAENLPRNELIQEVAERAKPIHQAIWLRCSKNEKLALIFLALDGLVHSCNTEVRQLIKRGLIVRRPRLSLMDDAFRRFVRDAAQHEDYVTWQREGRHSTWEAFRIPLLLLLLTLGAFLFLSQRDFFDSAIGIVSGVTGGLAAILRLLSTFRRDRSPDVSA